MIVPKYFLIAIWGSTNKEYGAMKLTLYSFFGRRARFHRHPGRLGHRRDARPAAACAFSILAATASWAFPVLFLGFAVLAGIWPLHTWAPTGHVAAPTAGSMLLAGIVMNLAPTARCASR